MTTTLRSLSQPPERVVQGTNFLELKARFRIQMVVLDFCKSRDREYMCSELF